MRLAEELQRRGFDCKLFTRAPAETNPEAPSVPVVGAHGATPLLIVESLRRQIAAFAPTDLMIQYTPQMFGAWRLGSPAIVWLAQWARRAGMNVVLLAHEMFLPWNRRPDLALGAALMRVQFAALMKSVHRVLVTVDRRAMEIEKLVGLVGVDPYPGVVRIGTAALPLSRSAGSGALRMGVFSTLAADKRFDVVLDCFAVVSARQPKAELVILGDLGGDDDPRVQALRRAIEAHPARDRIRLPGKQTLAEIAREVAALDVYLFPMSTGANTRSSTLPLALGTGVPVVAIRGSQTDDIFVDAENILFASALTGEAFAAATGRLVEEAGLAARVAEGAKNLYGRHLTWERIGDQLLAQV